MCIWTRTGAMNRPSMCLQSTTSRGRCPLWRGDGTAAALIARVLAAAGERWPGRGVRLLAPVSLRGFYEAFGFRKDEGPFVERGVRLIGLIRKSRHNGRMNQRAGEADFVDMVEEV